MSHVSVVRMIDLFLSVPKFNRLTGLVKSLLVCRLSQYVLDISYMIWIICKMILLYYTNKAQSFSSMFATENNYHL